jgi:predicted Zn-dependent protease
LADIDPFVEAKLQLFPPLESRILVEAADMLREGRVDAAREQISAFLDRHPRHVEAMYLMADAERRSGKLEEAERLLSQCVAQSPQSAGYRYNLAVVLRRRAKYAEALAELNNLLERDPRNPLFCDLKAKVLSSAGRQSEALGYRRELAQEYRHIATLWCSYGDSLRGPGFQDECIAAYRKAVELDPSLTDVYLRLCDLKTYRFSDTEIEQMQAQLSRTGLSERTGPIFISRWAEGMATANSMQSRLKIIPRATRCAALAWMPIRRG